MARALVVFTCFVLASAANYGDYTDVKMPMYGGEYEGEARASRPYADDEYREHPSEATVDYSYEDEKIASTDTAVDNEVFNVQSTRKSKKFLKPVADDDEYGIDKDMPVKVNRHSRQRGSSKVKNQEETDERVERDDQQLPKRRVAKSKRRRDYGTFNVDSIDKVDDYSNVEDTNHKTTNKNKEDNLHFKEYEDDNKNVQSNPKVRRKTNKFVIDRSDKDFSENGEEESPLLSREQIERRERNDVEYPIKRDSTRRRPVINNNYRPYDFNVKAQGDDNYDVVPIKTDLQQTPARTQSDDYRDNYDMDRVNKIQKKIPQLHRRSTVRPRVESWAPMTTGETWTRRLVPHVLAQISDIHETTTTAVLSTTSTTTSTTPIITSTTTASTTTITPTKTTITSSTTNITTKLSDEELSIAEKSRLSIMKKAARKDGEMSATTKPPVLLRVTVKQQTMVMVEPPIKVPVRSRVRIVSQDTPERIAKVKRLMRHKLVAKVKNIEELTDNWDEMVCDYVDMALIDDAIKISPAALPVVALLFYFL